MGLREDLFQLIMFSINAYLLDSSIGLVSAVARRAGVSLVPVRFSTSSLGLQEAPCFRKCSRKYSPKNNIKNASLLEALTGTAFILNFHC